MNLNILAIDPGSRYNGIAMYNEAKKQYLAMELTDYHQVWQLVMHGEWDYVVCEDFVAQQISHYGITTVRVVGGVEAICILRKIEMHRPNAGARVPFCARADILLTRIHGKKPPRDHQQSAMAHLLRFQKVMLGNDIPV